MLHQLNLDGKDKIQTAIEALQAANRLTHGRGLHLCFSGGKDSVCIKTLADMAGVKYDAHYQVTGIDPPELVRFIRESHPDVIWDYPKYPNDYRRENLRGKRVTMWNLIAHKGMPPTQMVRYCCEWLKERGGKGRLAVTGVRWAESPRRKKSHGKYTILNMSKTEKEKVLLDPNFHLTNKGGGDTI